MTASSLWQPITVGRMHLPHRLALAPMTRNRAQPDGTPGHLAVEYYAQRASLGLLITEGTQPSADGQGYPLSPGIHTPEHVAGWRAVAEAVHAAGGHFAIQLMHAGRWGHPDNTPHHRLPVAPSAVSAGQRIPTLAGMRETPIPGALDAAEIPGVIDEFRRAAACAIEAGADAVEVHAANGYLLHQFLSPDANLRTDAYGGSIEKRARLAVEVAEAVAQEIGADRTGIRLSPAFGLGGLDEGPDEAVHRQYLHLTHRLADLDLAYLHVHHRGDDVLLRAIRELWPSALLVARKGRTRDRIADDIEAGLADIVPLGRFALANPDIVGRLRTGAPLNEVDSSTVYGGTAVGYTDYPILTRA